MAVFRLLIVDDDRDLAASLAEYLEIDGHDVDMAFSGKAGIQAAVSQDYDLVLMDVVLPDVNGVEGRSAIKRAKPESRVLLMSGYSADHLPQNVTGRDAIEILVKPVDLNDLTRRLATIGGPA